MKRIALTAAFFILLSITAGLTALFAAGGCPQPEAVQKAVSEIFKKANIKVSKIAPSQAPGLCEVQLKLNEQTGIVYTDPKGDFLIAGQLYKTSDGTNITQKVAMELNRFSQADMERLAALTAFKIGKGKVVYIVTDPQCPY